MPEYTSQRCNLGRLHQKRSIFDAQLQFFVQIIHILVVLVIWCSTESNSSFFIFTLNYSKIEEIAKLFLIFARFISSHLGDFFVLINKS